MTEPRRRLTVLIVDSDLGLLFWLGGILTEAGCLAIPALDCRDTISIMRSLGIQLDAVFVNPHLNGVESMIQTLRWRHGDFKVVSLIDSHADLGGIRADGTLTIPRHGEPPSREDWLDRVAAMLRDLCKPDTGTNA